MAPKVHPKEVSASGTMRSDDALSMVGSTERKTLTLWMKSLIFHGRGLAVFDSNGKVIYRIDNYGEKCSQEVLLMDRVGQVVFTIIRKSQGLQCPWWEGYKVSKNNVLTDKQPLFWVKEHRNHRLFSRKNIMCEVINDTLYNHEPYKIVKSSRAKLECKIINAEGKVVAELKQKHGCRGVSLGRDVLSLEVEPEADVTFLVALVAVFGLINGQI